MILSPAGDESWANIMLMSKIVKERQGYEQISPGVNNYLGLNTDF